MVKTATVDDAIAWCRAWPENTNEDERLMIAEIVRLRGLLQATGDERDTLRQALQEIVEKGPPAEYERIARKALTP